MSLIQYDLFDEKRDKVQHAINLVRSFEPPDKYYLDKLNCPVLHLKYQSPL